MAQRKKKLMRRKKSASNRDHELQSDDEEFEVAAGVKDDENTVSFTHYSCAFFSSSTDSAVESPL